MQTKLFLEAWMIIKKIILNFEEQIEENILDSINIVLKITLDVLKLMMKFKKIESNKRFLWKFL